MTELYDDTLEPPRPEPMRLRDGWANYAACVLFQTALMYACFYRGWVPLSVVVLSWLALGWWLNRHVLRRLVDWHPVYNTVIQVTGDKVRFWLLWPIHYAILLVQLTLHRLL